MKGIFEFEVNGIKRGFKFGTYALAIAQERDGCELSTLFQRIGYGKMEGRNVNVMSLLNIFYGAAVHYAESKRQEIDFSASDVSDWLDEMGLEKTNNMLASGLETFTPKNSNSLPEEREKILV